MSRRTPFRLGPVLASLCVVLGVGALALATELAIQYADVTDAAGVANTWNGYGFGGGVAAEDFDDDGDADLLLLNASGTPNRLFDNRGDTEGTGVPTFVELTGAGMADLGNSKGVVCADFDNDGFVDIAVANYDEGADGRPPAAGFTSSVTLYRNQGDGTFADVTTAAGLQVTGLAAHGLSAADVDNDGWVDLFVCNRGVVADLPQGGGFNRLYRNQGDGTFADVSASSGLGTIRRMTFQSGFFDYDGDGDLDVYLCTDKLGGNELYRNDGTGVFTDVSAASGADVHMNGMCVAIGDYDNDLDFDVFVTNTPEGHALLRNEGNGTFTEVASAAGVTGSRIGWGSVWIDADNDGWLDLYTVAFGGTNSNQLFVNQHDGTFVDVAPQAGVTDPADGFGVACADFDLNGRPDFMISNRAARCGLYLHTGSTDPSVRFKLIGITSNRSAIGAHLTLHTSAGRRVAQVIAGDSYLSHSDLDVAFGLGGATADSLTIRWPSGLVETITGLAPGGEYRVVEGYGIQTGTLLESWEVTRPGNLVQLDWASAAWPADRAFRVHRLRVESGSVVEDVVLGDAPDGGRYHTYTDNLAGIVAGTYRYRVAVVHADDSETTVFESADMALTPTPVSIQDLAVAVADGRLHVSWRLAPEVWRAARGVEVHTSAAAAGPWTRRTARPLVPGPRMSWSDVLPARGGGAGGDGSGGDDGAGDVLWLRLAVLLRDDGAPSNGTPGGGAPGGVEFSHPVRIVLDTGLAGRRTRLRDVSAAPDGGGWRIRFDLARTAPVRLAVYDVRGRLVRTLARDIRPAGAYVLTWDGSDGRGRPAARGLYLVRLVSPGAADTRKLVHAQR